MGDKTLLRTYSTFVDLWHPEPDDFFFEDISISLARQYRFNGHTTQPYSVADHSVAVSKVLAMTYPNAPALALRGLFHDAHEAYIGDLPTPVLNALGPEVRREVNVLKQTLDDQIFAKFIPGWIDLDEDEELVHMADVAMLRVESKRLFVGGRDWNLPKVPLDMEIAAIEAFVSSYRPRWEESQRCFAEEYRYLKGKLK